MKVTLEHLTKRFDDVIAVNDLSETFESGKLIALLGPSGCGKSTMLNMLSGILPVSSGRIYFDDVDVTDLTPEKREVGLVFQNYALYPHMTVLQNIAFPLKIRKVPKAERNARALEFARMVHIEDYLDRHPAELSGGQQQRVAIARALVNDPVILLADEATGNLDTRTSYEIMSLFQELHSKGKTIAFVTHEPDIAEFTERTIQLRDGLILKDIPVATKSAAEALAALGPAGNDYYP